MTKNPRSGSSVEICYLPLRFLIEVQSLHDYIASYIGGRGDVRSMEGMIQNIAQDCADCIGQTVKVVAHLNLDPDQKMLVECTANAKIRKEP